VLSGGTSRADLERYAYGPELVVESVAEFSELMEQSNWRPFWRSPHYDRRVALART
jgi:hypothetical protein